MSALSLSEFSIVARIDADKLRKLFATDDVLRGLVRKIGPAKVIDAAGIAIAQKRLTELGVRRLSLAAVGTGQDE